MRVYWADSIEDGIAFEHVYAAESIEDAESIALANGWRCLGVLGSQNCPADLLAMVERDATGQTLH